jgi:uracil phosphoribosyltransferase/phosphoserine phosphatase/adenylate kinase
METSSQPKPVLGTKPKLIALFGLPGSGKTHLLSHLQQVLPDQHFVFFEGSAVIAQVAGSLDAFKSLPFADKCTIRQEAIQKIVDECIRSDKIGVMTAHYMFWEEGEVGPASVLTEKDLEAFTHVVYLDVAASVIRERVSTDRSRERKVSSEWHLAGWSRVEKNCLFMESLERGFLYTVVYELALTETMQSVMERMQEKREMIEEKVENLILDFAEHDEQVNTRRALDYLDDFLLLQSAIDTMLVIDGDKTLTEIDTGDELWKVLNTAVPRLKVSDPVDKIFEKMGYSYAAFRQVALKHSKSHDESEFEKVCQTAAATVKIHPEFLELVENIKQDSQQHVHAIVVTCGLKSVWQEVLHRAGLHNIHLIGNGQISNKFVVTPAVKAAIVQRQQQVYHMNVCAFGDSPIDFPMLKQADRAFVVVGRNEHRSKSMEHELATAVKSGLSAAQILLPPSATPRLHRDLLPVLKLKGLALPRVQSWNITLVHATTKPAAQLLQTESRNASIAGPALRKTHHDIGRYLALEYLTETISISPYAIPHVQGNLTTGHRLIDEDDTLIIAIMRGGEPMAMGVNEVFPLAAFHHFSKPEDVKEKNLRGMRTVVLVDSVINSGKSIAEYVNHIRGMDVKVRIVVVAGVVQEEAVKEGGGLVKQLNGFGRLDLVALRLSKNKYTGKKETVTGDRLFNTTYLD